MAVQGGIFGGLNFQPLGWPSMSSGPVDNAIGSTPASDPAVFDTGTSSFQYPVFTPTQGIDYTGSTFAPAGGFNTPGPTFMNTFPGVDVGGGFTNPLTGNPIPSSVPGGAVPISQAQMDNPNSPFNQSLLGDGSGGTVSAQGTFPDSSAGTVPAVSPDSGGSVSDTSGLTTDSSGGIQGPSIAGGGGGQGMPIDLGLQSSTTQFISGQSKQIESAFGSEAANILTAGQSAIGTFFAGFTDFSIRAVLIVLGIIITFIALWRILFPDESKEMMKAAFAAVKA
jgi:hypothetical protein